MTNILADLSAALSAHSREASAQVAAIRLSDARHLTGTLWSGDLVVASEQSLPKRDAYDIVVPGGAVVSATPAGRDPGTNVALLRLAQGVPFKPVAAAEPVLGALALSFGADGIGAATARLGVVHHAGPEWHSSHGGRIDRRIVLDQRLGRADEGGPVLDANGARLGISTFGPRRQTLVIPSATIDRVIQALAKDGRIARGWLGVALQPVAVPDALRDSAGQPSGLMVMSVADSGPAAGAGILAGDIVLTVDGTSVRRFRRIASQLGPDSIGRKADLRVIRGGQVLSLQATITERPAA
jgi:S1-C subfamily serine protease